MEKRTTSHGPHRDDFSININNIDTRNFGSQGQQRTSVLTIKFSSLEIIKEQTGEYPVLLLDDVLSELDLNRQKYILNSINNVQTIVTCTGIENIKSYLDEKAKIFIVENGKVTRDYILNQE
jgi:DNA replication and repair protein RecF